MSGKAILFLILGLLNVVDVIYKTATCPSCNGNFFGYEVSAITDYIVKALFAFILLRGFSRERQKQKNE